MNMLLRGQRSWAGLKNKSIQGTRLRNAEIWCSVVVSPNNKLRYVFSFFLSFPLLSSNSPSSESSTNHDVELSDHERWVRGFTNFDKGSTTDGARLNERERERRKKIKSQTIHGWAYSVILVFWTRRTFPSRKREKSSCVCVECLWGCVMESRGANKQSAAIG